MNKDGCFPKFFKVYLPCESGDDLTLPICFNSLLPSSLPKNVIVKSICGNVWKLELRKMCGDNIEKFVMVNGWKRIVKDEYLTGGEFLAFEFNGSRLFNVCIYGHKTCKRLRNLVQTKEIGDKSEDENDKSSDDIIVLSDDDDDVNDDQEYGDEDKSTDDIIVLSDDEDDEDNDNVEEEDKSSEDIVVLDDDDDDDDQDYGDAQDDDNERRRGDETERKEKGSSGFSKKIDGEVERQYPDNDMNSFFAVNQNLERRIDLHLPAKVVKDL